MFKYTPAGLALTQLLYSKAYALCFGEIHSECFYKKCLSYFVLLSYSYTIHTFNHLHVVLYMD